VAVGGGARQQARLGGLIQPLAESPAPLAVRGFSGWLRQLTCGPLMRTATGRRCTRAWARSMLGGLPMSAASRST
jgi:hypothetical protein